MLDDARAEARRLTLSSRRKQFGSTCTAQLSITACGCLPLYRAWPANAEQHVHVRWCVHGSTPYASHLRRLSSHGQVTESLNLVEIRANCYPIHVLTLYVLPRRQRGLGKP
jgi:hypothetical protein